MRQQIKTDGNEGAHIGMEGEELIIQSKGAAKYTNRIDMDHAIG